MEINRDEENVILPVRRISAFAESVPPVELKSAEDNTEEDESAAEYENKMPIDREEIAEARQILNKYIQAKKLYDQRYKNNWDTFMLLYSENESPDVYKNNAGELKKKLIPKKQGAQALNVILNKHADAMDNFPEVICLPRAFDDENTAKMLNNVLPCVLERSGFQRVYSKCCYDKFIGGVGWYSVIWDPDKENGLGDVSIVRADEMSLFWQPHIEDIQESRNVFYIRYFDLDEVKEMYPQIETITQSNEDITEYTTYDNTNKKTDKAAIIDWYYKKGGILHYCKFCGNEVLFATENEPDKYPDGFYAHGLYPFVADPCFEMRDTPVGFSYIDICRWPQLYLDGLKNDILKNVKVNSQTKSLVNRNAGINIDDLNDLDKDFVESDSTNGNETVPFETKDIASGALSMYNALIDEMKETTGTNDASNGASAAGVTSGSAIAALQEAGGKISRDNCKSSYLAFTEICSMIIELMRQFYTLPRYFRIDGEDNKTEYQTFDNSGLMKQVIKDDEGAFGEEIFERLPIFDIKVKAQKASPFATMAINQMMMDMFGAGVFAPTNADAALIMLEGMCFEGKENIVQMIKKNKTLDKVCQELYQQLQMSSAMLANKEAVNAGGLINDTSKLQPQAL